MESSENDQGDKQIDIQDYAGALLDGLESLKDSGLSLEEVQDRFDQILDDKSTKLGNLELTERLKLKVLARPGSPEAQQALEAGFEEMKAVWAQAIEEADSRLEVAGAAALAIDQQLTLQQGAQ